MGDLWHTLGNHSALALLVLLGLLVHLGALIGDHLVAALADGQHIGIGNAERDDVCEHACWKRAAAWTCEFER